MAFSKNASKLMIVAAMAVSATACLDQNKPVTVETDEQKIAYTLGYNFGTQVEANTDKIDVAVISAGLKDAMAKADGKLTKEEMAAAMETFRVKRQEVMTKKMAEAETENKTKGEAFLAENKVKEGVVTLDSGLQYKVVTAGSGAMPTAEDQVKVHYKGTLIDGTEFDSSYKRGQPAQFPLNGVIKGWTEALQLMKTGGKWELYIPSDLAYGPRGPGAIGPNATLVFEVELLEIVAQEAGQTQDAGQTQEAQ